MVKYIHYEDYEIDKLSKFSQLLGVLGDFEYHFTTSLFIIS